MHKKKWRVLIIAIPNAVTECLTLIRKGWLITAIIQEDKLDSVREALVSAEIGRITVTSRWPWTPRKDRDLSRPNRP